MISVAAMDPEQLPCYIHLLNAKMWSWYQTVRQIRLLMPVRHILIGKVSISLSIYIKFTIIISISANGRLNIVKKCWPSLWSLSDLNSWTDECDRKSDEESYACTSCCRNLLCNGQRQLSSFFCTCIDMQNKQLNINYLSYSTHFKY